MRPNDPILYAEDSDDDVFLLQRAFVRARMTQPLVTVRDGRAAVEYLRSAFGGGSGALRGQRPLPGLVLLDVKMPYLSGLEVLRWIRGSESRCSTLPVLMLSSSDRDEEIERSLDLGANGYLVKPSCPEELDGLVSGLKQTLEHVESANWRYLPGARVPH